jgi:hypothetical protein
MVCFKEYRQSEAEKDYEYHPYHQGLENQRVNETCPSFQSQNKVNFSYL